MGVTVGAVYKWEAGKRRKMKRKQWLKKSCAVVVAMASLFMICGCGNKEKDLQPHEWIMDGKVVSYYDSTEDINEKICPIYDEYISGAMSDSMNWVVSREDDEIRSFCTQDNSVVTYKGISVGDKVSVVEDTFSYERGIGESFNVYFDGTTEVDIEEHGYEEELLVLYYYVEEDIIKAIYVMDGLFGMTME